jgi:hypothetical protein
MIDAIVLLKYLLVLSAWILFNEYFSWVDALARNAGAVLICLLLWGTVTAYQLYQDGVQIAKYKEENHSN